MRKLDSYGKRLAPGLTVFCAFILLSQVVSAQTPDTLKKVVVIGNATIYQGNPAAARQAAINDGLNAALDAVVVELLSPESLVGHFQSINQAIEGKTGDFIQGYKVLGEYKSGKKYRVVVEAKLSPEAISRQLAALSIAVGQAELPKVLFFMSQQNTEGTLEQYWWGGESQISMAPVDRAMAEVLTLKGFRVADPGRRSSGAARRTIDFPAAIDTASALLLAADYGAGLIIIGTAVAGPAPNTMGATRRSYAATVKARAFKVDSGAELAMTENEAVAAGSNDVAGGGKAIQVAAALAAEELAAQIIAVWGKEGQELSAIKIAVEGTRDLANFVMFRRVIKKIPNVERLKTLEMKPDQAIIEVDYKGTAETFADTLMLSPFENFRLDIYEVSGELIRVALIPR